MKTNIQQKITIWTILLLSISTVLTVAVPAQRLSAKGEQPAAAVYPYDPADEYYRSQGVDPIGIIGRRTGYDGLSVIDQSGPRDSQIRVTATIGGYNYLGEPLFWYPLGDLQQTGFTNDKAGTYARFIAAQFPVYIFPDRMTAERGSFAGTRQAPIFDDSRAVYVRRDANPLNLRTIFSVSYTDIAFDKQSVGIMNYFADKNGLASDGTPRIADIKDMWFLENNGFVRIDPPAKDAIPGTPQYAIAPYLGGRLAVAEDAILIGATLNGGPLPSELLFHQQFDCLKKTGDWCLKQ